MSMLAERKRKQKWCLNPRGKDWSEDSNKFGQKLLEKMGWSKGKGLGVNEDGITEHVKVSFKNDNKGMGFKEDQDPWTENEVGFSNLLKDLSAQNEVYTPQLGSDGTSDNSVESNETVKIQSLEKKSQASRARVHYRKFTRGKDLSRYSSKDLANIFGKSSLKGIPSTSRKKSDEDQVSSTTSYYEGEGESSRNFVTSGSNINQYFENKMQTKRFNVPSTVTSSEVDEASESSDDDSIPETVTLATLPAASSSTGEAVTTTSYSVEDPYKKKKKKKASHTVTSENGFGSYPDSSLQLESNYYKVVESKKDRKKRKKDSRCEESLKIKLKKKHIYDNPGLNLSYTHDDMDNLNNFGEVTRGHHHKSKKKVKGIENPGLELSDPDESPPRKRKRKTTFVSYLNTDSSMGSMALNTLTVKSVPRKRKRSHTMYDNPAFHSHNTDSDDTDDINNVVHKVLPEIMQEGICNPALDLDDSLSGSPQRKRRNETEVIHYDVVYNSEPNTPKSALKKGTEVIKTRKSVQINESINQEKFITDESENSHEGISIDNDLDEENTSISKRIEDYQTELENSLNEKKCETVEDYTSKKFKNIALKKLTKRRASVEFPGVKHETIIKGYGVKE